MKYTRKEMVVDAMQYDGKNKEEVVEFIKDHGGLSDEVLLIYFNVGDFFLSNGHSFEKLSKERFESEFQPVTEDAAEPKIWDRLPESIKRDGIIYALVIGRVKNWIIGYQFIDPDWEVEHLFSVEAPDFETCCQKALDKIKEMGL